MCEGATASCQSSCTITQMTCGDAQLPGVSHRSHGIYDDDDPMQILCSQPPSQERSPSPPTATTMQSASLANRNGNDSDPDSTMTTNQNNQSQRPRCDIDGIDDRNRLTVPIGWRGRGKKCKIESTVTMPVPRKSTDGLNAMDAGKTVKVYNLKNGMSAYQSGGLWHFYDENFLRGRRLTDFCDLKAPFYSVKQNRWMASKDYKRTKRGRRLKGNTQVWPALALRSEEVEKTGMTSYSGVSVCVCGAQSECRCVFVICCVQRMTWKWPASWANA